MVVLSPKDIIREVIERNLIEHFKAFRNISLISNYRRKQF